MTNRRAQECGNCGTWTEAGTGKLWKCIGSSSGCFLDGHEENGGWHVTCADRAACVERVKAARAAADARHQAAAVRARALGALEAEFSVGDRPAGPLVLEGEEVPLSGMDHRIYGGGEWAVIAADKIWLVQNNGADGDAWANNNIRTGGAGAIGWSLSRTPELEARVRHLAEKKP